MKLNRMYNSNKIISVPISKSEVLREVAQKTGYTGAKMESEVDRFDNIATVDEDKNELMEFWGECRANLAIEFAEMIAHEGGWADGEMSGDDSVDGYCLQLSVNSAFNDALVPALKIMLKNYFVYGILFRWYMYTNKEEASAYEQAAAGYLGDIRGTTTMKAFTRRPSLY